MRGAHHIITLFMSCCSGDGEVKELNKSAHGAHDKHAPSLSLTPEAADFVKELLKKEGKPDGYGLKIEVVPGGCAGYQYVMSLEEKPDAGDRTIEAHGIKVFLSLMSLGMLKGSTIEFVQSLEATGLRVNNPNASRGCGCGKSFS